MRRLQLSCEQPRLNTASAQRAHRAKGPPHQHSQGGPRSQRRGRTAPILGARGGAGRAQCDLAGGAGGRTCSVAGSGRRRRPRPTAPGCTLRSPRASPAAPAAAPPPSRRRRSTAPAAPAPANPHPPSSPAFSRAASPPFRRRLRPERQFWLQSDMKSELWSAYENLTALDILNDHNLCDILTMMSGCHGLHELRKAC